MTALAPSRQRSRDQGIPDDEHSQYASHGNGTEARRLEMLAREAFVHRNATAEALIAVTDHADGHSYQPVPSNRMFYVKTRYVYGGKGTPLPFDLDDE